MNLYARTLSALLAILSLSDIALADDGLSEHETRYVAARESERVARLRSSAIGTRDFCSITRSSSDPVQKDGEGKVTCHFNFGPTSLAELEAGGWKVAAQERSAYTTRWGFQVETVALTIVKVRQP
ncbi:hypothetical protein [Variovorax sp. GT1P44]|uniref:hypothetical protein n=1 Tax=Variovorax sp. GT1P44 TaxID=3443742 RepID=UPI003F46585D